MNLPARFALPALCLIVFTDLMGFGIILPLLPYAADTFGGSGLAIGTLFASYSIAQLISAPLLGRASDRFGRKPVLLLALSGSVVSALLMANTTSLTGLLVARVVAGACGGSIAVAHAFAADLTPPAQRTRSLGLLGAAVGCGFVAGPAIGALLAHQGLSGAGVVSACVAAAALCLAAAALPDPRGNGAAQRRAHKQKTEHRTGPVGMRPLLVAAFCTTAAFCAMEATLALLGTDTYGFGPRALGWMLAAAGITMAVAQGGLAAPLAARFGTRTLATVGALVLGAGLGCLPLLPAWGAVTALMAASIGQGLLAPALSTLVADAAPDRTGAAMGAVQSAMALARATAPALAGTAYDLRPLLPYLSALALAVVAAACIRALPGPVRTRANEPAVKENPA
ncbi:MFS transporter [Streptomyces sp. NPDC058985]|uniref:MFS transporter n=1 Tax=Streptomyces sp. NPDC058985 TaxID=3346684 RepID=UPI0036A159CE